MGQFAEAAGKSGSRMRMFGGITIVLGLVAMLTPMLTGYSIIMLIGGLVVVAGGMRMVWAFGAGTLGKGLLVFALGGLTLLCGLALLANPLFASGLVTLLMTIYFIADGAAEFAAGLGRRPESGWGWLLFGGLVSIALGIMLWRQAPLSGAWALGLFFGIKLLFAGIMMLTLGSAVRAAARA
jgi:uncharacterized membrane protein HdeD (DUF308 family)